MIIFNDPNLQLADVLDEGESVISIPDQFSPEGLIGKEGPMGPQGPTGPAGPEGPIPTSIPGTNITSPVRESQKIDNSSQTLALSGANGANVTLIAPSSGNMSVTLPNGGGTLATINGPTPIAIAPSAKDIEGTDTIDATNLNYITITDSDTGSIDTLQNITGGSKGQQLILELNADMNFYADNQDSPNTIQWGRGTGIGTTLPASDREMFRFIYNGTAWFLVDRFTL